MSTFCCDTVHAQFFRQNPLACPITNFHLLSNVANGSTSILTDELVGHWKDYLESEVQYTHQWNSLFQPTNQPKV